MTINYIRAINSIVVIILALSHHLVYGWYLAAMHLSLELLNRQSQYRQQSYKLYNCLFVLYEGVLLARVRSFYFNNNTEWLINCAEHLLFGIIICVMIYIYTALFSRSYYLSRLQRALIAFTVFNLVGVFNEIFQNELARRARFIFIPDSIKDIRVNLIGAFVFALVVLGRIGWLKYAKHIGTRSVNSL